MGERESDSAEWASSLTRADRRERPGRLSAVHPYWLLAMAISLTVAALITSLRIAAERDEAKFLNAAATVQDNIRTRLEAYISVLIATRSLLASREGAVDASTFRAFVTDLQIDERYPGIQGVGFTRRLRPADIESVVREMRQQGHERFHVWPDHPRDEYHAIVFLEPLDRRNRAALGYDMSSEPVRRAAMERARDSGLPSASGRVTLVQEIDPRKQSGFLIYVPVYERSQTPPNVEARRAALYGFVYGPFRVDDLMHGLFGTQHAPYVEFDLYDGDEPSTAGLMHQGITRPPDDSDRSAVVSLVAAGRLWTLHIVTTPAFAAASTARLFPYLLGVGLLANFAFFLASRQLVRAREQETAARARLSTLAEVSKRFAEARLELPVVLRTVCHEVAHRVTESCTISLIDEAGTHLRLADTRHLNAEAEASTRAVLDAVPIPVGEMTVGRVAASGKPLLIPHVPPERAITESRPEYQSHLRRFPLSSLIIVPLRVGERVIGTVTSGRGPGYPAFTVHDQQLLQDIADRAASAVENARLAERLRLSMLEAQQAVQLRDEFLSIAGHELRTPLAALQLHVESLVRQADLGAFSGSAPRLLARLSKAQAQVARLEVLIAGLLDVSQLAAGKLTLEYDYVDLAALLREIVERFQDHSKRANSDITLIAPERAVGYWDRSRLDQIFTNLIGNALKYGAGEPIDIEVALREDTVAVSVRDRGIGISREDSARVFERFERAVSERHYGGLGLGLWISRQIADALGGTLELESQVGVGSTFTVELPRGEPGRRSIQ